jgi:hypothetical protein
MNTYLVVQTQPLYTADENNINSVKVERVLVTAATNPLYVVEAGSAASAVEVVEHAVGAASGAYTALQVTPASWTAVAA